MSTQPKMVLYNQHGTKLTITLGAFLIRATPMGEDGNGTPMFKICGDMWSFTENKND